jgi:2-polyprenyl-3-methyl-5-hydroxy-6-metoxy-1,4-benzoquinol methylase
MSVPLFVILALCAGDGGLFTLLPRHWRCRGYDLQPDSVRAAAVRGFDVRLGDVLELTPQEATADAVVCTEMIEHLLDPHAFVRQLRAWPIGYVVASSPATETDQAHYEYHCWAWDLAGYRALFEGAGFDVVRHETVGAFQVLGAVPR